MSLRYKVRAYCTTRTCDYIQPQDLIETADHHTSITYAMSLNESERSLACPQCGDPMQFYPFASIQDAPLPEGEGVSPTNGLPSSGLHP